MKYILFSTSGLTHPPTLSLSLSLCAPPTGEEATRDSTAPLPPTPPAATVTPLRSRRRITQPLPILGVRAVRPPPPGSTLRAAAGSPPPRAAFVKAR